MTKWRSSGFFFNFLSVVLELDNSMPQNLLLISFIIMLLNCEKQRQLQLKEELDLQIWSIRE